VRPQLAIHFPGPYDLWCVVQREDSLAAELADGHYSRQTPGADGFMPPGFCVAFVHHGPTGSAVWSAVFNVFRDVWRWRNTIFRNKSGTLSSSLISAATNATYLEWARVYGWMPIARLTSEIDIEATRSRRSKRHEPGHCYREAGWREVSRRRREHGRPACVVLEAPR